MRGLIWYNHMGALFQLCFGLKAVLQHHVAVKSLERESRQRSFSVWLRPCRRDMPSRLGRLVSFAGGQ